MKKLILIALTFVLVFPNNGCRILKHKTLDKKSEQITIQNDLKINTKLVDSVTSLQKYFSDKSFTTVKEVISYKTAPDDEPIELTASFTLDTSKSLKGDTAFTLVGKGVSLTITRNPLNNNLTANIKTAGKTRSVAVNELLINRTITNNKNITDSSKVNVSVKKLEKDSVDKSKTKIKKSESHMEKIKEKKPTGYTFLIIVVCVLIVAFFLWLKFK